MVKEQSSNHDIAGNAELVQRLKLQEKLIEDFKASVSWRLTEPLRWVSGIVKRLLRLPLPEPTVSKPTLKDYAEWIHQFDEHSPEVNANLLAQMNGFAQTPLYSVLLPVESADADELRITITSILEQIYPHWELCIAIGLGVSADVRTLLDTYAQADSRIKISACHATDMAALSNHAFELVCDQSNWIVRVGTIVSIAPHALIMLAIAENDIENCQIIYADEDVQQMQGQRAQPDFKPDWNLELHYSRNLIGCLGVYRTALVRQVGGFQTGMSDALDFDLSLRCLEHVTDNQILHLPYVLFHGASTLSKASDAGVQALNAHFLRQNIRANAENIGHGYRIHYALPELLPRVSLIIPTRNGVDLLRMCIDSIQQKTSYANFEIIVVDNGSDELATLNYLEALAKQENIRILRIDAPFNYSALNNAAVNVASGELIALVNNDIEVISPDWLSEMVSHAVRPGVGAVGARLWFPNETLQHGGVVLGLGGVAGHAHMGIARGQLGYQGRAALVQNLSAVTAACLVIKKSIFEAVGGLNEQDLAVAFNDVDFCLRVREAGYRNVWTPFAELYHHESASRGYEDTPEKQRRFTKEMAYMHQRWGAMLQADPAYGPNLTLQADDFGLAWPPRLPPLAKAISLQPNQPPLSERFASLTKGQVRIAYFAENVQSSTFRYRSANMAAVLNELVAEGEVQICAACFFSSDLQHSPQIVKNADLLVISRARYDPDLAALVYAFQAQGKRVLFDLDDLVFDTQAIELIISTSGQQASDEVLNYWYSVVGRMAQALQLCDGAITTNAYLANKIRKFSNLPVKVIPNFANKAQMFVSEPFYQKKKLQNLTVSPQKQKRIKLGYFSGSSSHNGDLSIISHALERVMATDLRIDLVFVGHLDVQKAFGDRFGGYLKGHLADRVTFHPFVDFLKLQELIAGVDFNLVPLQVNEFTNCKSELKFVDAAIVGTLTIASPTYTYAEAIRHSDNGYLAEDDQWEAVLLRAIGIMDTNLEQHQSMVDAAYKDVQSRFTWQTQRPTIMQALEVG